MALGGWIGSLFGGPLGAVFGAALGHQVEKRCRRGSPVARRRMSGAAAPLSASRRAIVFCASAAAMLAKMAKADGRISANEIAGVEQAFARLGFSARAREYAIGVFRQAKDDPHTIFEYADEFAEAVESVEVRELFYEILWDIACADGTVLESERRLLRQMPRALRIRAEWYAFFANQRLSARRAETPRDELMAAYALLDATPDDTPDALKRKYRLLAKKNHPDVLRAQGLPDELIGKATERMGRINEAWTAIRSARGI